MTAEEEKTIRLLETRTRQLILKFTQVKEDNEELLEELVKKDNELQEVKKQNKQLMTDLSIPAISFHRNRRRILLRFGSLPALGRGGGGLLP